MNNAKIKNLENILDERFLIAQNTDDRLGNGGGNNFLPNNPDYIFYKGMLATVEAMGFAWERITNNGQVKHIIYK